MLILNREHQHALLTLPEIIDAVEKAMLANEQKNCIAPQRMHIDFGSNTFLVMPSFSGAYYGTKLVSVVPGNAGKQLPVTNGAMLLNDCETGLPVALLNAAALTALRTGAVGAMGLKYMSPESTDSIGIIGCGVQGIHQVVFACAVRPVKKVYCLYRSAESFEQLKTTIAKWHPQVEIIVCHQAEELLTATDVLIAATTSPNPVLPDNQHLLQGKLFISVGSYKPDMQELPDAVYKLAGKLIIDSEGALHETGDTVLTVKKGLLKKEHIYTMGKLMLNSQQVSLPQTRAYKTAGMALFDLFVASAMYEAALRKGIGEKISL